MRRIINLICVFQPFRWGRRPRRRRRLCEWMHGLRPEMWLILHTSIWNTVTIWLKDSYITVDLKAVDFSNNKWKHKKCLSLVKMVKSRITLITRKAVQLQLMHWAVHSSPIPTVLHHLIITFILPISRVTTRWHEMSFFYETKIHANTLMYNLTISTLTPILNRLLQEVN